MKNKYNQLIFKLDNCISYYDTSGKLRKNVYEVSKDGVYLGIFKTIPEITKHIGCTTFDTMGLINTLYNKKASEGWEVVKINAKKYSKYGHGNEKRELVQLCDGIIVNKFDNMVEASKVTGFNINSLRAHVSGDRLKRVQGFKFEWRKNEV